MQFDARQAECLVFTYKDGLLSRVGHDLKLRCDRWSITLDEGKVEATFDADAWTCLAAMKGGRENPGALSDKDKRQVVENMRKSVLLPHKHPQIRFVSNHVARDGNALSVRGDLHLHGRVRPVQTTARRIADHWIAEVELDQADYGIKPFTALMGTLKVKPRVKVRLKVPVER